MSAGKVTIDTDVISPKTPTGLRVAFTKTAGNKDSLALVDITDNDYVTKNMIASFISNSPQETIIEAGVTPVPIVVAFLSDTYPRWNAVKTDTGEYDQTYPVKYDMIAQQFVINAMDDGSGKALENYSFTINP